MRHPSCLVYCGGFLRVGQSPGLRKIFTKRHASRKKKPYSMSSLGCGPIVCPWLPGAEGSLKLWLQETLWQLGQQAGKAYDEHSRSLRLCSSVALVELSVLPSVLPPLGGQAASEHSQVVTGLGAGLECPAAGAGGCQACQEATSTLAKARPPSGDGLLRSCAVRTA